MKLVEMKCPFCGGQVNLDKLKDNMVTCEYCGNRFLVDDEKQQNITNYNIYHYGDKAAGRSAGSALAIGGGFLALLICVTVIGSMTSGADKREPAVELNDWYGQGAWAEERTYEDAEETERERSPLYGSIVEAVFDKPLSSVSGEEIGRIKYLKVSNTLEASGVWYSFDDPYGVEEPVITKLSLPRQDWQAEDMNYFPGLVKADVAYGLSETADFSKLESLRGLICSGIEPEEAAAMAGDATRLIELGIDDAASLDGIERFPNLEILSLEDVEGSDLKPLLTLKKLRVLNIKDSMDEGETDIITGEKVSRIKDFSAISVMPQLQVLSLDTDAIRGAGFIKGLSGLTSLTLKNTGIISLEPLAGMEGLRALTLVDNGGLQDFKALEGLSGLQELTVGKLTSQPDPGLSGLTGLTKLDISGFMSVTSLRGLSGLEELSVHSCNLDGADALATLTGVEKLTLYGVWNSYGNLRNLDFINGMTGLKYADFYGNLDGSGWDGFRYSLEIYGDVSNVFNLPGLEELYLNGGDFEIDFDEIKENTTLRVLGMEGMSLHENYYVESTGGMSSVWYDDVKLDEHTDFLERFPNLEELYLGKNQLTQAGFAAGLKKLVRLDLRDNYITDLSPLAQAEGLRYLNIMDNPAGSTDGMNGEIEITR